jgi:site-specific DNA recombinase
VVEGLVWDTVVQLLASPALVRGEIDRRLAEVRASSPVDLKREGATKELARLRAGITRLLEAYQEQLISLDELRARVPPLRQREATVHATLAALEAELLDAETYLALAESLKGFWRSSTMRRSRWGSSIASGSSASWSSRSRSARTPLSSSIPSPLPDHHPNPGYLLRTWHHDGPI